MSWSQDVKKYHHSGNKNERGLVLSAIAGIAMGIAAGVGGLLGGGALAMGVGAVVAAGAIGAAGWGIAKGIGAIFNPKSGKMEDPKQVEGTPNWKTAQASAAEGEKRRRLQIADASGTHLTSPMGLTQAPNVERKTLLGA